MANARCNAVIRKAEDDAETRLLRELERKFSVMGKSALKRDVLNAIGAGDLALVFQLLDFAGFTEDAGNISQILADSARRTGIGRLRGMLDRARAREEAARATALRMPHTGVINIAFDVVDMNVVRYGERRAAELVVEISETMRATIREHIVTAVKAGHGSPQRTARILARIVPLHSRYARAVVRREETLLAQYLKGGMAEDKATAKAAQMADRYAAKLTRSRARTIARTEIMTASNYGQLEGVRTSMGAGLMTDPSVGKYLVTKEWVTAEDERVCPVCGPLHDTQVDFNEPFPNGTLVPPAHPNCRCSFNVIDNADQWDFDGDGTAEEEYADLTPLMHAQMRFGII